MLPAIESLSQYHHWVCWKFEQRNGKQTKIPKNPKTGGNAISTNPQTWASYETALAGVDKFRFDGIGFVFSPDVDICGIDLDDCLDPSTGKLQDWAALVVEQMASYTEISPSGRGLKIFFRGTIPACGKKGQIEIYNQGRYFTLTEEHWTASPNRLNERIEQARLIFDRFFGQPEKDKPAPPKPQHVSLDDRQLLEKAQNAANGAKFNSLWQGETNGYHSRSEAHLALCNLLAFWTGGDGQRMDQLFRQSAFYQDYAEKWDKRHSSKGLTYGQMTIAKAIKQTNTYYTPTNGHIQRPQEPETETDQPDPEREFVPTYSVQNGQMLYTTWKTVSGDIIPVKKYVAPFTCYIEEKLTIFEEFDQYVIYTLEGKKGNIPFTAKVTADDWADPKKLVSCILRYLPGKPPDTDPNLRKHWGPAISALTDERQMKQIKAIPSTGWSPDGKAFVMPRGGVGKGYMCQLDPGIEQELGAFGLTEQSTTDNRMALAALISLTGVYKQSVIYTLIAHAFLAPLLRWVGNEARYLYHIHADTGSLKTELAKLIMSLYGPLDSQGITYKWTNTPYGAESRAYTLKDCLMLIDDLKPGAINEVDKAKWVAFVQAAVDAMGRKRATISGRAAASLPPRALILSTGEAIPEAGEASYTARMLLAELNRQPDSVRNQTLDRIKAKAHLFSGLMYDYIIWLLQGDGQGALETFRQLQSESSIITQHTRLSANSASNRLGAVILVKFCQARGYLGERAGRLFLEKHWQGLNEIVSQTDAKAHSERYSQRFITALKDAIDTGFCYLSDAARDRRVGWQDQTYIYLLSGSKEIVDQWLRQSGQTPINISKKDLRKQLFDDGLTYSTEGRVNRGFHDYQALDPATDKKIMVTALYIEHLDQILNNETDHKDKNI